jgi:hypothetical protein
MNLNTKIQRSKVVEYVYTQMLMYGLVVLSSRLYPCCPSNLDINAP